MRRFTFIDTQTHTDTTIYTHTHTNIYIYIWGGGSLGSIVGGQVARARVILVFRDCIWNAPGISLVLPDVDDTASLGSPPHQVVYLPS